MTVCIAAIHDGNNILGAADRMLTAGDIQFQPEQPKLYQLTTSMVAMISGDVSLHAEVYTGVRGSIAHRLAVDSSKWLAVKDIAGDYERVYAEVKRRRAERDLLIPLGLDTNSFIARQAQMSADIASKLTSEILNYQMPDTGIIIAGIDDDGAHLYAGVDGKLSCEDAVGFAAIGAGHWHAQSQFMFARYARTAPAAKALYLVYAAKKRAETAPGVGTETDMFLMGPKPGTYQLFRTQIVDDLGKIYAENIKESRRVYQRTEKKVNEYIENYGKAPSIPEDQSTSAIPERPASLDGEKDGKTAPEPIEKKKAV